MVHLGGGDGSRRRGGVGVVGGSDERGAPSAGGGDERVGGAVELDEVRHRGLAAVVAEDAPLGGVARPGVHLHRPRRRGGAGIGRDRRPPRGGRGEGAEAVREGTPALAGHHPPRA